MSKISIFVEGQAAFNVECRVSAEELKHWEPERIAQFFDGIAMVLKAKHGSTAPLAELNEARKAAGR